MYMLFVCTCVYVTLLLFMARQFCHLLHLVSAVPNLAGIVCKDNWRLYRKGNY